MAPIMLFARWKLVKGGGLDERERWNRCKKGPITHFARWKLVRGGRKMACLVGWRLGEMGGR